MFQAFCEQHWSLKAVLLELRLAARQAFLLSERSLNLDQHSPLKLKQWGEVQTSLGNELREELGFRFFDSHYVPMGKIGGQT